MDVKVRDRKTNLERTVTKKAYEIIPHRYDFLGYLDDNGNVIEGQAPQVRTIQKKTQEKSVEPVAAKIEVRPVLTSDEIEQKRAEMDAMNQEAIQSRTKETVIQPEVKARRKPGPKPRNNA